MSVVPNVLARNWRLKLSAFGLSVFLWALVRAEPDRGAGQSIPAIPVRAQVNDPQWTLVGDPDPPTVEVRFEGPVSELLALGQNREATTVRIPIDEVSGRDTVVEIRRDWVVTPGRSLVVQEIVPSTVSLSFDRADSQALPISVRTVGELPPEVALAAELGVTPSVVTVQGAASRLGGLDSVTTEPLDLSTLTESAVVRLAIDTTGFRGLAVSPQTAQVGVRLEEAMERIFGGVPVVPADTSIDRTRFEFSPPTIQVTLRGARSLVSRANPDELGVVIPAEVLGGLQPGEERRVVVRIRGVPDMVRAFSAVDSLTVLRLPEDPPPPGALP